MAGKKLKKIDILGKTFRITYDPQLASIDAASGKCKSDLCQIWVGTESDPQQIRDTMLHEVLHAVYGEMGLGEDIEDKYEESIVRRLATGLLYVIRHNPKLMDFLEKD